MPRGGACRLAAGIRHSFSLTFTASVVRASPWLVPRFIRGLPYLSILIS